MIEKLTITKIYINDKDKEGHEFITKNGKKFHKIAIQVDDKKYAGEYLSDFLFDEEDERFGWKPGYVASIIVKRNGQWLNFKMPDRVDYLEQRLEAVEDLIRNGFQGDKLAPATINELEEEIKAEEIPF